MQEPAPAVLERPAAAAAAPRPIADRLVNLAWGSLGAVPLLTAAVILTPSDKGVGTHQQLGLPPCTFLYLSGLPCPFCGMTTSWTHAAHGDLVSAFVTQPMGLVFFLVDLGLVLWIFAQLVLGGRPFRPDRFLGAIPIPVWYSGLAGTVIAWLYKIAVVRGFV